jgi:hypothetical protein
MKMMQSSICSSPELIDPRYNQLRLPPSTSSKSFYGSIECYAVLQQMSEVIVIKPNQ